MDVPDWVWLLIIVGIVFLAFMRHGGGMFSDGGDDGNGGNGD